MQDDEDRRWEAYFYSRHSPAELREWAPRLRWFRFCLAFGAHNNDGDSLRLALRAETEDELHAVLAALGLTPTTPPEQPGHVRIAGQASFAWAYSDRVEVTLHDPDDIYEVTSRTVASAVTIEAMLTTQTALASSVVDPPLDDPHCVCPTYYPHFWTSSPTCG